MVIRTPGSTVRLPLVYVCVCYVFILSLGRGKLCEEMSPLTPVDLFTNAVTHTQSMKSYYLQAPGDMHLNVHSM